MTTYRVTPIAIRIPVTTYQEVELGEGFKQLLARTLFPAHFDTHVYSDGSGNKVAAIKAVRAELGIGLKEAKDIVDALSPAMLGLAS